MQLVPKEIIDKILDPNVPDKKNEKKDSTTTLRLPRNLYSGIKHCAISLGVTNQKIVTEALKIYLDLLTNKNFQKNLEHADSVHEAVMTAINSHNDIKNTKIVETNVSASQNNSDKKQFIQPVKRRRMAAR